MSNEDKARQLADRIADSLRATDSPSSYGGDWDDLQAKLDKMYQEMQPEARTMSTAPASFISKAAPAVQTAGVSHVSQERFNINEAIVDELVEFFEKEKACSFEPNGKPCDHCAMCSSRGF